MEGQRALNADYVDDWHGWQVGDVSIHIGHLPGRLNPCVYVQRGCVIETLAHFRGERANEKAYRMLAILDRLVAGSWAGTATHIDGTGA